MARIDAIVATSPASTTPIAALVIDPFGDRATRGHLRNRVGTSDLLEIARLETVSVAASLLPALEALRSAPTIRYQDVLDTHRRLFDSVYPWAGEDRGALLTEAPSARMSGLFATPSDVRRSTEAALTLGLDPAAMRERPGEVFGRLAQAHPFLEGNGRVLMAVHADLARRADMHVDWSQITKPSFMTALARELKAPGTAMDALIRPHVHTGALTPAQNAEALTTVLVGKRSGPSPSM